MEQIKNDQIITITTDQVASSASSTSTATNEKKKVEGNYDINDVTVQYERSAKRTELIQSTEKGSTSAKNPVYVEWHGVNYSIADKNKKKSWSWRNFGNSDSRLESGKHMRTIIENIHGCANPGEILAIMGPSGCGKTTLLNILGDRLGSKGVQGSITLNGHKPTKSSKRFIACCAQDDVFFPQLTVKETLNFTARLRLPRSMSRRDKLKQVDSIMALLNLTKAANTKMGDHRTRGVSGGERKRTSIASELLTDPSVILLDEPTSGLDSSLALELTRILKEFAVRQKKTIIMVIHQPSPLVFESFDKLMLMADGQMVYFGERASMMDYLSNQGFKCHPNFNPADYILELLNDDTIKKKLINTYAHRIRDDPTGKQIVEKYSLRTRNDNKLGDNNISHAPVTSKRRWEATFFQQLSILTERAFKQSRKIILSKIGFFQTIALSIICIVAWFQMPYTEKNMSDRVGSIFFTCVFWTFHPLLGAVSSFPLDLVMLSKERQSRSYRLLSYYLSKQFAELPLIIFYPTLYIIIVYWATDLLPDFGRFVAYLLVILLGTITAQGIGYLFGATLLNVQKSVSVGLVYMNISLILGGFFAKHLPFGLGWVKYISFIKYSYSLVMQIQFDTSEAQFRCSTPEELLPGQLSICDVGEDGSIKSIPGSTILRNEGLDDLPWYFNLIILLAICIGSRVLAYYSLRRNTRKIK